jgi:tRNA-2-methylthio-N6-dimethylallyladenosine synthase
VNKTYYLKTFGCQSNKNDSERIAGYYQNLNFKPTDNWQKANHIIINTCSVRKSAEDRARALLHKMSVYSKKKKYKFKIILTGCMNHFGQEKIKEILPMVDEVWPAGAIDFKQIALRTNKKHGFVQISNGCNSFCSYCIVPFARGREKSRSEAEILREINTLVKKSYQEITLLGQNVNSWGLEKISISKRKNLSNKDQYKKFEGLPPFVKLLKKISEFKEINKIRFMTSNPWDFYDELIEEIGSNKKIDRYVHLPLQSGSDSVLKRMNRGYTAKQYLAIIKKLKNLDKNIIFGTDIIVGFPNETEKEFEETLNFVNIIKFKVGFVAMYSPRPKTLANKIYEDNVPYITKKKRFDILDKIINKDNLLDRPKIV